MAAQRELDSSFCIFADDFNSTSESAAQWVTQFQYGCEKSREREFTLYSYSWTGITYERSDTLNVHLRRPAAADLVPIHTPTQPVVATLLGFGLGANVLLQDLPEITELAERTGIAIDRVVLLAPLQSVPIETLDIWLHGDLPGIRRRLAANHRRSDHSWSLELHHYEFPLNRGIPVQVVIGEADDLAGTAPFWQRLEARQGFSCHSLSFQFTESAGEATVRRQIRYHEVLRASAMLRQTVCSLLDW